MPARSVTVTAKFEKNDGECRYFDSARMTKTGQYTVLMNGKEMGKFTFTKVKNGWAIQDAEGKYLAFNENTKALETGDKAYTWTYSGEALFASVSTRATRRGWFMWWRPTVRTTHYYLTAKDGQLAVSTTRAAVKLGKWETAEAHDYVYQSIDENEHKGVCSHCGAETEAAPHEEGDTCAVCGHTKAGAVTVTCGVSYEPGYWFFWWNPGNYTAWADVQGNGRKITKVEISRNGEHFTRGNSFTSRHKVTEFFVRVTTDDGTITTWQYKDCKTTKVTEEPDDKPV